MYPLLYEINTRCWLQQLSQDTGWTVTLGNVPLDEFQEWKRHGFTHIWLMGVWSTGPLARLEAMSAGSLRQSYSEALPDWAESDVTGSPYAIADYHVSKSLGGDEGLKQFRGRLRAHDIKLVLDFVPNHLGVDHPWLSSQPDLFVQSPTYFPETFARDTSVGSFWLAHGKDPYFAAWTDTVQIDYRQEKTQLAMIDLLRSLSARCDGLRCDMAMLLLKDIFAKTWERFPSSGAATAAEFWQAAIPAIKSEHSDFLFLAEAYWGTESRLLNLGFDYTYDKTLYDRLVNRDVRGVHQHLMDSPVELISRSAHFLENHDEPRIASLLSPAEQRAAALLILGLPGMRFLHQGQLSGARSKVPVQLGRCARELPQPEIVSIYEDLLTRLTGAGVGLGQARLLRPTQAWEGNPTAGNIIVIQWEPRPPGFVLVVTNLAPHRGQCYVHITVSHLKVHDWSMKDLLGTEKYTRTGQEMHDHGLYLDLGAHAAQLFLFEPVSVPDTATLSDYANTAKHI